MQLTDFLIENFKIYIQPINYPTVPRGTERIRLTPSANHTDSMIKDLLFALKNAWQNKTITTCNKCPGVYDSTPVYKIWM